MSNPSVIFLDSASDKKRRFDIEDNIGEAIHIHIDNLRIDFTIDEFLEFAKTVRESLNNLEILHGYSPDDFDEHFLRLCAPCITDLKEMVVEDASLSSLECIVHKEYKGGLALEKVLPVDQTPAYKYLQGEKDEFLKYNQFNYWNTANEVRLLTLRKSIENHGYPYKKQHIVLFNNQNLIRDGQHRAAVLAHLYGVDSIVPVMRFRFHQDRHSLSIGRENAIRSCKWFVKKCYRRLQWTGKRLLGK